ncbi:hypothetical protein ACNKFW_21675 (plasmid) [Paracoccus sp. TD-10]|uniref:hypothetical protein n=1 Tax=Paracoccus sp. TD-10 TaxID=3395918 RepID=UPI003AAE6CF7
MSGRGAVPIRNMMEDAATAEISRAQLWQWLRRGRAGERRMAGRSDASRDRPHPRPAGPERAPSRPLRRGRAHPARGGDGRDLARFYHPAGLCRAERAGLRGPDGHHPHACSLWRAACPGCPALPPAAPADSRTDHAERKHHEQKDLFGNTSNG